MATTSPVGGTTSLPQYLQQRKAAPEDGPRPAAPKTAPTVTPPASGSPQAPAATAPTAAPSPHPVSTTGNPTIPPAPPSPAPVLGGAMGGAVGIAMGQRPQGPPPGGAMGGAAGLAAGGSNLSSMLERLKAMQAAGAAPQTASAVPFTGPMVNASGGASLSNPGAGSGMIGGMTAPAAGVPQPAAAPAAPAPTAPAPSMHPVATPPPAAAPAAPPPIATGDTGQAPGGGPIALDRLRQVLEGALGGNGRYSDDLVSRLRAQSQHGLEDVRRTEEDRLKADAASRGMFHSTGLSTSLGDASQRYVRGMADAETGLLGRIADANAQDKQTAIGNVFQFGQGEQENQRLQAYIAALLAEQGSAGGPTIPGAVGEYGTLPTPGTADNSDIYKLLGSVLAPPPPTTAERTR